jgi:hypothetical protein
MRAIHLGRLVRRQWGWSRVYTRKRRRAFPSTGITCTGAEEDVPYVGIRTNGALGWSMETTYQSAGRWKPRINHKCCQLLGTIVHGHSCAYAVLRFAAPQPVTTLVSVFIEQLPS